MGKSLKCRFGHHDYETISAQLDVCKVCGHKRQVGNYGEGVGGGI